VHSLKENAMKNLTLAFAVFAVLAGSFAVATPALSSAQDAELARLSPVSFEPGDDDDKDDDDDDEDYI
jgi:hypothetical protein